MIQTKENRHDRKRENAICFDDCLEILITLLMNSYGNITYSKEIWEYNL